MLNVALVVETILVFANTILRSVFNRSLLMGVDETSYLFLVVVAFLGGAVAYGRGQFIAVTLVVEKLPRSWQLFCSASVQWIIILISALIGVNSLRLLSLNYEETTLLLGISYAWMTLPITAGSALFVIHAWLQLWQHPRRAIVASLAVIGALIGLAIAIANGKWSNPSMLQVSSEKLLCSRST